MLNETFSVILKHSEMVLRSKDFFFFARVNSIQYTQFENDQKSLISNFWFLAACNFESIARFTRKLMKGDHLSDFHTFCNNGENKVEEQVHHFPALGQNKALLVMLQQISFVGSFAHLQYWMRRTKAFINQDYYSLRCLCRRFFKTNPPRSRCLKITEKVSFNIASEASFVYISLKGTKNGQFWRVFENQKLSVKQCYQTG